MLFQVGFAGGNFVLQDLHANYKYGAGCLINDFINNIVSENFSYPVSLS
jgi:hypothetical protein